MIKLDNILIMQTETKLLKYSMYGWFL